MYKMNNGGDDDDGDDKLSKIIAGKTLVPLLKSKTCHDNMGRKK